MTDAEFESRARKLLNAKGATKIEIVTQAVGSAVQPVIGASCMYRGNRMEVAFSASSDEKLNDVSKRHILLAIEVLGSQ